LTKPDILRRDQPDLSDERFHSPASNLRFAASRNRDQAGGLFRQGRSPQLVACQLACGLLPFRRSVELETRLPSHPHHCINHPRRLFALRAFNTPSWHHCDRRLGRGGNLIHISDQLFLVICVLLAVRCHPIIFRMSAVRRTSGCFSGLGIIRHGISVEDLGRYYGQLHERGSSERISGRIYVSLE